MHVSLFSDPTSPRTLTSSSSSSCWASHRKTHWPLQRANEFVCICMCICTFYFVNTLIYFLWLLCSIWIWAEQKTRASSGSQVVPFTSQAHLHPLDSTACHLIACTALYAEELAACSSAFSPYNHMLSQACIMNTHTHVCLHTHSSSNESASVLKKQGLRKLVEPLAC